MRRRIRLVNAQSPGDGVAILYALQCLFHAYPSKYEVCLNVAYPQIFQGVPECYVGEPQPGDIIWRGDYPDINQSNQTPVKFILGPLHNLETVLDVRIPPIDPRGCLPMEPEETRWFSQPRQELGRDVPYWVVNAGWKNDFTAKQWPISYWASMLKLCRGIQFVQVGHTDHNHFVLRGPNVINLVGKTDLRQLVRLIWNAYGVVTPVSLPMVLAYALPAHPRFKRKSRACVVIAGGREPNVWQQLPEHQFLHTCGALSCCDHGGCWKSRVTRLGDGDKKDSDLCINPVRVLGQAVPQCMEMIKPSMVAQAIKLYQDNLEWKDEQTDIRARQVRELETAKA